MQGLGAGPISLFGSRELKEKYLPRVATGDAIAAFAISEADAGSDVAAMHTTARATVRTTSSTARRPGSRMAASPISTSSSAGEGVARRGVDRCEAPTAERAASSSRSLSSRAIRDSASSSGSRPSRRIRWRRFASRIAACPPNRVVGEPGKGLKVALATLDVFRSTVGAAALGFARRALDEALAHVSSRQIFGQALQDFQLTQARIAEMATAIDASALLVYRAAWTRDNGAPRVTREAAMAKMFATEAAQRVIDDAVQLLGGRGVVAGHPVEQLYREIRSLRIYEGTTEVQQLVIAAQVLEAWSKTAKTDGLRQADCGHVDTFCADHLPPPELWPVRDWTGIPELAYPPRLNCADELLDQTVARGIGDRPVFQFPGGSWTYRAADRDVEPHRQRAGG